MSALNLHRLQDLQVELDQHPIYEALHDLEDLRVFMAHHAFSVWDFMCLIKCLQGHIAPSEVPWIPRGDPALRYYINQLVLEEESDTAPGLDHLRYASHFEYYLAAMREAGADTAPPLGFLDLVQQQGIDAALYSDLVPLPARYFCETTFCFIREDKPHVAAAALALGRERMVPNMFRRLVDTLDWSAATTPAFHHYLLRHIHMEQDAHGPLSLRLLNSLCRGDPDLIDEAETAAEEAICARIRFWDGVLDAVLAHRGD
jgi:hypothetical protein